MGTGDVNFRQILSLINHNQTFIVETWQGHKNSGVGFIEELNFLDSVVT
jgi:hypothetical protein